MYLSWCTIIQYQARCKKFVRASLKTFMSCPYVYHTHNYVLISYTLNETIYIQYGTSFPLPKTNLQELCTIGILGKYVIFKFLSCQKKHDDDDNNDHTFSANIYFHGTKRWWRLLVKCRRSSMHTLKVHAQRWFLNKKWTWWRSQGDNARQNVSLLCHKI